MQEKLISKIKVAFDSNSTTIPVLPIMRNDITHKEYIKEFSMTIAMGDINVNITHEDLMTYIDKKNTIKQVWLNTKKHKAILEAMKQIGSNEIAIYGSKSLEQGGITFAPYTTEVNYLKFTPTTCYRMFYDCNKLTKIDLSQLKTYQVIDMYMMFSQCIKLTTLDVSKFDTHCVRNMNNMFMNCIQLTQLDVSNFDTRNVTDMYNMFYNCSALTQLDVSNWNTGNVTDMYGMFGNCSALTQLDVSNWNTGNVIYMACMFDSCKALTQLDVSNWNTGNVVTMSQMFQYCNKLTQLNVSSFDTSNVTNMSKMFYNCSALTELDVNNWDVSNVTTMNAMFRNCTKLQIIHTSNWKLSKIDNMALMFHTCTLLTDVDTSNWNMNNVTNINGMFANCMNLQNININNWKFNQQVSAVTVFSNCCTLSQIDMSNWNMNKITSGANIFQTCNNLTNIKVNTINNITLTMFDSLPTLTGKKGIIEYKSTEVELLDLSEKGYSFFDVSESKLIAKLTTNTNNISGIPCNVILEDAIKNVKYMDKYKIQLVINGTVVAYTQEDNYGQIKSGNIFVSKSPNANLFPQIKSLLIEGQENEILIYASKEVEYSGIKINQGYTKIEIIDFKPTICHNMFARCTTLTEVDLHGLDTSNVINMYNMFYNCSALTQLDLNHFNTSKVEYMNMMFNGCSGLTKLAIDKWDVHKCKDMTLMLNNTSKLTTLDFSKWNVSNLQVATSMFYNCGINLDSFHSLNTNNAININGILYGYPLKNQVDYSKVRDRRGINLSYFYENATNVDLELIKPYMNECGSLFNTFRGVKVSSLDLSDLDTSHVQDMGEMFSNCSNLKTLNITNINTRNVTSMSNMFYNCSALTELDVSHFDTKNVTNMIYMFDGCSVLTELDVSNWNTRNVTDMSYMFYGCKSLTELNVDNFITNKVTSINSMFIGCIKLTEINLNNFNTKSLKYANYVFKDCTMLEKVDISKWILSNNCSTTSMFDNCTNLIELDINTINSKMRDVLNTLPTLVNKKGIIKYKKSNVELPDLSAKGYSFFDVSESKLIAKLTTNTNNISSTPIYVIMGDSATNVYQYMDKYKIQLVINGTVVSYTQKDMYAYITGNGIMPYCTNGNLLPQIKSFLIAGQENEILVYASKEVEYGGIKINDGYTKIEIIDFKPTICCYMFSNCTTLEIDLHGLDTSNVTTMSSMFENHSTLTELDLSNFNTKNVTTMTYMFSKCSKLTQLDVSNWDTKNVTSMSSMFNSCSALTQLDVSNWDTKNVTSMSSMFYNCSALTQLDVSNWDTKNVTFMNGMFNNCKSLTQLDVSNFDTRNVTNMSSMFNNCSKLTHMDYSMWNMSNVLSISYIFSNCGIDLDSFYSLNTNNAININGITSGYPLKNQVNYSKVRDRRGINLSYFYENATNVDLELIKPYMSECGSLHSTFYNCKVTELDLNDLDTSHVQDMGEMFSNCSNLKTLNITNINTRNVTIIYSMFYNCSALTQLDVSNFDTKNVTSMSQMFAYCSALTQLDVSNFDTKNVTSMNNMFAKCTKIVKLDISKWDLQNINIIKTIFANCTALEELNIGKCSFAHISNLSNNITLQTCTSLTHIEIDTIDETMAGILTTLPTLVNKKGVIIYQNATVELPDLSSKGYLFFKLPKEKDMKLIAKGKFNYANNLSDILVVPLMHDKSMDKVYYDKYKIQLVINGQVISYTQDDVTCGIAINGSLFPIKYYNTELVNQIQSMLIQGENEILIYASPEVEQGGIRFVGAFTKIQIVDFIPVTCAYMFSGQNKMVTLNVDKLNTKYVHNMKNMFGGCTELISLDVSNWDTRNVTNMRSMFISTSFTTLDLSNFNTKNVTDMTYMFMYCNKLVSLDLSNFDTRNVTTMDSMFMICTALTQLDVSNWDTRNVTNMDGMFAGCKALTSINISHFNTSKVTTMLQIFNSCKSLTSLDLSTLNTTSCENVGKFLVTCDNLINVKFNVINEKVVEILNTLSPLSNGKKGIIEYKSTKVELPDLSEKGYSFAKMKLIAKIDYELSTTNLHMPVLPIMENLNSGSDKSLYMDKYVIRLVINGNALSYTQNDLTFTIGHDTKEKITYTNKEDLLNKFTSLLHEGENKIDVYASEDVEEGRIKFANGCKRISIVNFNPYSCEQMFAPLQEVMESNNMITSCSTIEEINVAGLNMNGVKDASSMFESCDRLINIDLHTLDMKQVIYVSNMFKDCRLLQTVNMSTWDTSNIMETSSMFENCSSLKAVDLSHWNMQSIYSIDNMFRNCSSLIKLDLTCFTFAPIIPYDLLDGCHKLARKNVKVSCEEMQQLVNKYVYDMKLIAKGKYTTTLARPASIKDPEIVSSKEVALQCPIIPNNQYENKTYYDNYKITLVINGKSISYGYDEIYGSANSKDGYIECTYTSEFNNQISKLLNKKENDILVYASSDVELGGIQFNNGFTEIQIIDFKPHSCFVMFGECYQLTKLNIHKLNTSNCVDMSGMFGGCGKITHIDVSNLNTHNVQNMRYMFAWCSSLIQLDVNNFDITNCINMTGMFSGCASVQKIVTGHWNIDVNTNIALMFYQCDQLKHLDLSHWKITSIWDNNTAWITFNEDCVDISHMNILYNHNDYTMKCFLIANHYQPQHKPQLIMKYIINIQNEEELQIFKNGDNYPCAYEISALFPATMRVVVNGISYQYHSSQQNEVYENMIKLWKIGENTIEIYNVDDALLILPYIINPLGSEILYCYGLPWISSYQFICSQCKNIHLKYYDMSFTEYTNGMFESCEAETIILDTHINNVINMDDMFKGCPNLQHVEIYSLDLTNCISYDKVFDRSPQLTKENIIVHHLIDPNNIWDDILDTINDEVN